MKRIRVLTEAPSGLAEYLRQEGDAASWDGLGSHRGSSQSKQELVEALSVNQHWLCAYCEVDLHPRDREIEHVVPRSDTTRGGSSRSLDVANMVACCRGNAPYSAAPEVVGDPARHRPPIKRHLSCGQAKADTSDQDFLDPRELPTLPSLVRVLSNGELEPDDDACSVLGVAAERVRRTIGVLRLNVLRLRDARADRFARLRDRMERYRGDEDAWRDAAKAELLPDGSSRLQRFFTTARSYFGDLGEEVLAERPRRWI